MYSFSMFPIVALEEEDLACFLHEEIQKKKKMLNTLVAYLDFQI